jgi:hypothetical protein
MVPPARPGHRRPARPGPSTPHLVLIALVVLAAAILLALVIDRAQTGNGAQFSFDGPTGQPSGSARSGGSAFDPNRVTVTLQPFVGGLSAPLAITNAGDSSGRLFVAEQGGQIIID